MPHQQLPRGLAGQGVGAGDGRQAPGLDRDVLGVVAARPGIEGGLAGGGGDQQPLAVEQQGLPLGTDPQALKIVADAGQGHARDQHPLQDPPAIPDRQGIKAVQQGPVLALGQAHGQAPGPRRGGAGRGVPGPAGGVIVGVKVLARFEQFPLPALLVGPIAVEVPAGGGVAATDNPVVGGPRRQHHELPPLGHQTDAVHPGEEPQLAGEVPLQGGTVRRVQAALADQGGVGLDDLGEGREDAGQTQIDALGDLPQQPLGHVRHGLPPALVGEEPDGQGGADHQQGEGGDQQGAQGGRGQGRPDLRPRAVSRGTERRGRLGGLGFHWLKRVGGPSSLVGRLVVVRLAETASGGGIMPRGLSSAWRTWFRPLALAT